MELETATTIILGTVTGIVTSFVIWLFSIFFKKIFIPWYKSLLYEGIFVDGVWNCHYGESSEKYGTVILNQKGHSIDGEMSIFLQPKKIPDNKIFSCRGKFINGNLILNYDSKDKKRLGSGSLVMTLLNDGRTLEGQRLYINSENGGVSIIKETWSRDTK